MKSVIILLLLSLIFNSVCFAETPTLRSGDCFKYTDSSIKNKIRYMVGRIEFLNFGTFDYEGTLYVKAEDHKKIVPFHFQLPLSKAGKYPKIACPKNLPPLKKQ